MIKPELDAQPGAEEGDAVHFISLVFCTGSLHCRFVSGSWPVRFTSAALFLHLRGVREALQSLTVISPTCSQNRFGS